MQTNFSQETAQTKFDEYTYRIEALCNRIEELKAQIEVISTMLSSPDKVLKR